MGATDRPASRTAPNALVARNWGPSAGQFRGALGILLTDPHRCRRSVSRARRSARLQKHSFVECVTNLPARRHRYADDVWASLFQLSCLGSRLAAHIWRTESGENSEIQDSTCWLGHRARDLGRSGGSERCVLGGMDLGLRPLEFGRLEVIQPSNGSCRFGRSVPALRRARGPTRKRDVHGHRFRCQVVESPRAGWSLAWEPLSDSVGVTRPLTTSQNRIGEQSRFSRRVSEPFVRCALAPGSCGEHQQIAIGISDGDPVFVPVGITRAHASPACVLDTRQ